MAFRFRRSCSVTRVSRPTQGPQPKCHLSAWNINREAVDTSIQSFCEFLDDAVDSGIPGAKLR